MLRANLLTALTIWQRNVPLSIGNFPALLVRQRRAPTGFVGRNNGCRQDEQGGSHPAMPPRDQAGAKMAELNRSLEHLVIMAGADRSLREHLLYLLQGGGAHVKFDEVVARTSAQRRGQKPPGLPHTLWMLLEHMRLAQWDILEFSRNPKHVSPDWPKGYWPRTEAPPNTAAWNASIRRFRADLKAMQTLVKNPRTDLFARLPWGDGQTILREALLVADHNSYHLGQMLDVRRLLRSWPES